MFASWFCGSIVVIPKHTRRIVHVWCCVCSGCGLGADHSHTLQWDGGGVGLVGQGNHDLLIRDCAWWGIVCEERKRKCACIHAHTTWLDDLHEVRDADEMEGNKVYIHARVVMKEEKEGREEVCGVPRKGAMVSLRGEEGVVCA